MVDPQSPPSSPPRSSSVEDDDNTLDPADYPLSVDHPVPPPPDNVILSLPATPSLLELYFPTPPTDPEASPSDSAAASSTATEVDLTAPHQNPTDAGANNASGYQEPVMSNRFRLLVKSLDQFLDLIVAPVTVENLKTELTNMSRDDPHQAQAYVDGVRHYVIERSKRHLVWFLHTEKLKEKLDRLDRDIYEARLQVRDKEERAAAAGTMPEPLTLQELHELMPDPFKAVEAIRNQVLHTSFADLRREREKVEQEVAQDLAKLKALKAKYVEMLEQRNAMQQQFKDQMRPLVEMDMTAVDEVLAQGEEMLIEARDALPPLS